MKELVEYLGSLSDEDRAVAIKALPKEQRDELISYMLHRVNTIARAIIDNSEHLWLTGDLPETP